MSFQVWPDPSGRLDPGRFGPPTSPVPSRKKVRRIQRRAGEYIGYIPLATAKVAAGLSPATFWVYAMCRHYRDLRKLETVSVSLEELRQGVVSRTTVRRALRLLESEHLVEVVYESGRKLVVTVFDVPSRNPAPILVRRAQQRAWREQQKGGAA
jgi:hypothetical protein